MSSHDIIRELIDLFMDFPGIGPRQARRFVEHLIRLPPNRVQKLNQAIEDLGRQVRHCELCQRWFVGDKNLCRLCLDESRESASLLVVEKDVDLENIERSGSFRGRYFVLNVPSAILKSGVWSNEQSLNRLFKTIDHWADGRGLREVVLAISATQDGQYLSAILREVLLPQVEKHHLTLSALGRGLATGAELEYSDAETIKHAFKNRGAV